MYAIAEVFYGVPLVSNKHALKLTPYLAEMIEEGDEEYGVQTFYSGSSNDTPAAFGVHLDSFDEGCAYVDPREVSMSPTPAQVDEYKRLVDNFPDPATKAWLQKQTPFVFFLWSTS